MVVDDEPIAFAVYQTIRRLHHVATEEETRRRERWDARHRNDWDNWDERPSIPYYDFTPTGETAIEIAGWSRYENAQRRFADTRARKIDRRTGLVCRIRGWQEGGAGRSSPDPLRRPSHRWRKNQP